MEIKEETKAALLITALSLYMIFKGPETYTQPKNNATIDTAPNLKDTINCTIKDISTIRNAYLDLNGEIMFSEQFANPYVNGPKYFHFKIPVPKGVNKIGITYENGNYEIKKVSIKRNIQ